MSRLKAIDGLPVIDAKRPIRLKITKQDVSRADPKRPETCAAARAIMRETHAQEARVHLGRIYVRANKGNWQRYITPRSLKAEVIAFDRGGKFEPGEHLLLPPTASNKLGARRHPGPKKTKGKKRRPPHIITNVRTGPA